MKQKIIELLSRENTIRTIIHNVSKNNNDTDLEDLEQDIFVQLIEKDDDVIEDLYFKNQLNYYITRIVINNIDSKTSRYYYKYKKNNINNVPLDEWKETAD